MINYPDPYVKGFYTFDEAIEYARHEIGRNYHVSQLINTLNKASASSSRQSNNPVDSASIASSSSSSIQFYGHCEAMARAIRKLNETKYHLDSTVTSCSQRITALESVNIELIRQLTIQDKSHVLDTRHHGRQNKQTIIRKKWNELEKWKFSFFPKREYPLPIHLIQKIRQDAAKSAIDKHVYIIKFLIDLAISVPLERFPCQCHLPSACIDLARYKPLEIQYKNEKIVLTPTLLLDYGLLGQLIFSDLDQIDSFGRKIATVVLNTFANTNNPFVELIIDSKPLE